MHTRIRLTSFLLFDGKFERLFHKIVCLFVITWILLHNAFDHLLKRFLHSNYSVDSNGAGMRGTPSRKCLTNAPIKIAKKSANMKSCSRRVNRITDQYTTTMHFVTSSTSYQSRFRPHASAVAHVYLAVTGWCAFSSGHALCTAKRPANSPAYCSTNQPLRPLNCLHRPTWPRLNRFSLHPPLSRPPLRHALPSSLTLGSWGADERENR